MFTNNSTCSMTPCPGISLATCQGVIDIWRKVLWNKLYEIGHVLFHETPKGSIEQSFKSGHTIKLDTTFKFHETKFHRVAWAYMKDSLKNKQDLSDMSTL